MGNLDPAHVQPTILALANLGVERPGWDSMCREIVTTLDPTGIPLYESFQSMNGGSNNTDDLKEAETKIERLIKAGDAILSEPLPWANNQVVDAWDKAKRDG